MKTLNNLLDDAVKRMDLVTDAELARLVGVSSNSLWAWRKGHSVPTNDRVKLLADLADWTEPEALFWATYWRADEEARASLMQAKKWLGAMFVCVFLGLCGPAPAQANELATLHNGLSGNIYYHTIIQGGIRVWADRKPARFSSRLGC